MEVQKESEWLGQAKYTANYQTIDERASSYINLGAIQHSWPRDPPSSPTQMNEGTIFLGLLGIFSNDFNRIGAVMHYLISMVTLYGLFINPESDIPSINQWVIILTPIVNFI